MSSIYRHLQGLKIAAHFVLFFLAYYLSFGFRFSFDIPSEYLDLFCLTLPIVIVIKLLVFWRYAMFRGSWRYVGTHDMVNLVKASIISNMLAIPVIYTFFLHRGYARSFLVMDFILTLVLVVGARFSLRLIREFRVDRIKRIGKRVLIVGAGDAGESLLREIQRTFTPNYHVVAFFDDDPSQFGLNIHNVPVYGPIDQIHIFSADQEIDQIFIAIPSAKRDRMRRIVELCQETKCEIKTIPGLSQLMDGRITVNQLREVQIEDLLRRDPVKLDHASIALYLQGKTVLVTGAAGSIGTEICRQVLRFNPKKLILFDQAETGMFEIQNEILDSYPDAEIIPYLGDVCDKNRVELVMKRHKPEVLFHAAAYKHVPLMEENPTEALKNNLLGTKIVADLAQVNGVKRFVFISTDKAVNPTSVMGATKRLAELYLKKVNSKNGTKYIMVRFGNVLDSAGSVVPTFRRQIAKGGPVTVTHSEITRFFMTIPEATQLVLQAAAMGQGGEIFFLDMGEPIKIVDLARDMIRLSGLVPDEDIAITFTGIRPGEKLFEELWHENDMKPTRHQKIFIKSSSVVLPENFESAIELILDLNIDGEHGGIREKIAEIVPEYRSDVFNTT